MQQHSQDQQQQQLQRFYRQELKEIAQTQERLRAQYRPDQGDSDSDYDSRSDDEDPPIEAANMDTHIPESNIGYKLLLKMGWKAGTGLGQAATGRTAPIPIDIKQDQQGIGRRELAELLDESSTSKRRALEAERQADETEEDKQKREEHVQKKMAVQAELETIKSAFYCALCDKQYERISDYEVHLSSYDHNHKKRFKEMKETSRAGAANVTNKAKEKERKREEKELAKLQEAAFKKAGGGSNPQISQGITIPQQPQPKPTVTVSSVLGGFQSVVGETTNAKASTSTGTTGVSGGFQPVKFGGFQSVKVGKGPQPVKLGGFQPEEEDEPDQPLTSTSSTTTSAPASAPSGFQPVKLGGFKPRKIGGFQIKKPGNK
ncbi:hypothetical protein BGZ76_009970 [Entomortierella beljakovae]|nr:hypothetical protein BGZ76_009970 [Entomortierella beljakovae]